MNVLFLIFKCKDQIRRLCVTNGSQNTELTRKEKKIAHQSFLSLTPFLCLFLEWFQTNPPEIKTSWDEVDF